MQISSGSKVALVVLALLGLVAFLVIVDLGISAGRIHSGVAVDGIDVGGLTVTEATNLLDRRGEELKITPVTMTTEGLRCDFVPEDLGWGPQPSDTAEDALRVGRDDAPFGALADRVHGWLGGVRVGWAGSPNPRKVGRWINECEQRGTVVGLAVDRARLRYRVKVAITTWPRRPFEIPLSG